MVQVSEDGWVLCCVPGCQRKYSCSSEAESLPQRLEEIGCTVYPDGTVECAEHALLKTPAYAHIL